MLITCSKILELDILRFLTYVAHRSIIHCILIALPCESHEAILRPNIIILTFGDRYQPLARDSQGRRALRENNKEVTPDHRKCKDNKPSHGIFLSVANKRDSFLHISAPRKMRSDPSLSLTTSPQSSVEQFWCIRRYSLRARAS